MKLLDFNPFGEVTDSLLYSWHELLDEHLLEVVDNDCLIAKRIELRIIDTNLGINANEYMVYSRPKDVLDSECFDEKTIDDLDELSSIINQVVKKFIF